RTWLRRLFGWEQAIDEGEDAAASSTERRRTFAEFRDPVTNGQYRQISAAELVSYTFEAFEAWAGDQGQPRTPDQTPQELVQSIVPKQSPMFNEARRMTALYSEAAYSAATVSHEAAASLRPLWKMMRSPATPERLPA
ncbi:MAG: DUF4129 domain-containing protein, partial [Planctomycetota bacterium]